MKLISLKIKDKFRSLHNGFEINFHSPDAATFEGHDLGQFHPFCFVGLNGTGKSNVLEALANILYHLESCALKYQPDSFEKHFNPAVCSPDAFDFEYYIGLSEGSAYTLLDFHIVRIIKKKGKVPVMEVKQYPFLEHEEWIPIDVTYDQQRDFAPSKMYLPDLVVAYSSGENEILSIPFIKTKLLQYDEYLQALEKKEAYEKPESSLLYMDYEMSQAVLLANILFQEERTLEPLREELGITKIKSFRLNINLHQHKFINENSIEETVVLTEQLNKKLTKLKNCATCWYEDKVSGRLVLDYYVEETTRQAVKDKKNFVDAFDFFRTLQILYVLNHRLVGKDIKEDVYQSRGYYTEGKIPTEHSSNQVFYFLDYYIEIKRPNDETPKLLLMRQLSDGEHQFLHTLGICLLLKQHRTLILLDEPETHFNPDWRSKFIKLLKTSIDISGNNNLLTDILLTSHSPFIISDCLPDKVIVFERVIDGKISAKNASELNIPTFGTSINLITNRIFKKKETIGKYSLEKINDFRKRFYSGENIDDLIDELNKEMGDSIEKLLLLKEMKVPHQLQ